jgi:outer membrane protein assembly factor BamA
MRHHSKISLVYVLAFLCLFAGMVLVYGQGNTMNKSASPIPVIRKIEIHLSEPISGKVDTGEKSFRLQPASETIMKNLQQDVLEAFRKSGYYLVRLDSVCMDKTTEDNVFVHLFLTAGPYFILSDVVWNLPDSLRPEFQNQISEKVQLYTGKTYTDELQKDLFRSLVSLFENDGYPLCRIETIGFDIDSLKNSRMGFILRIDINPGDKVNISSLRLPQNSDISVRYLERVFRFKKNEIFRQQAVERYERLLRRQDFIRKTDPPELLVGADSLYVLQLNFEKAPSTSLDGIVGYIPPPLNEPSRNGYFTGLFNIGLRNLLGTGRRLDVFWQKPDRYSEEFRVKYREPFVFGLPFNMGGMMHRLIRDTTYIEWEYSVGAEFPLSEFLTASARFYSRDVFPDSLASRRQRLPQTHSVSTELGVSWDTRDEIYNPRRGLLFSINFDYGTQRNVGPYYLLQEDSLVDKTDVTKMRGEFSVFLPVFRKQVIAAELHTVLIGYQGEKVRPPDMFWFGGATTLRGYREDQFFGDRVGWANLEYRFLLAPLSRMFVFTDLGYFSREMPEPQKEFLVSYGVGIGFPGPLGILQVDYGLARGSSFSEGKIHFRIINEF